MFDAPWSPSLVGSSCYVGETCLLLVSASRFAHPHARPRVLASLPAPPSASTAAPRSHVRVFRPRWRSPSTCASRLVLEISREHGSRGTDPRASSASPTPVPRILAGDHVSRVTSPTRRPSTCLSEGVRVRTRTRPGSNRRDLRSRIG